jgi:hypothetical protein
MASDNFERCLAITLKWSIAISGDFCLTLPIEKPLRINAPLALARYSELR